MVKFFSMIETFNFVSSKDFTLIYEEENEIQTLLIDIDQKQLNSTNEAVTNQGLLGRALEHALIGDLLR